MTPNTPAIIGDKTTTPKITWPALSNILAKRINSSVENTGSFGNGGLIKTIYAQDNTESNILSIPDVYYPFRSLFTGRRQEELEFGIKDYPDYFSFTTRIPTDIAGGKLVLPELVKEEVTEYDSNDLKITTEKLPEIYLDGELVEVGPPERSDLLREISLPYIREGNLEVRVPKLRGY